MAKKKTKVIKEKDYHFDITLKFGQIVPATNKAEALAILDDTFFEEYGITLDPKREVKLISTSKTNER